MNQILVTDSVYVTPELKRKKKIYKVLFVISSFLLVCFSTVYIYAEYDRNKESDISKNILKDMDEKKDETTVSDAENALIVKITQDVAKETVEEKDEVEEIPESNKPAVSVYVDKKGNEYSYIARVIIPKIEVDYPIFEEWNYELLKVSICKFHGANPNEVGNMCLIGHNFWNKRFFSRIMNLENGDIVQIQELDGTTVEYEVYDIHLVDPKNIDDTTQMTDGRKEVTLITCTKDSSQRVIVKCKEKI